MCSLDAAVSIGFAQEVYTFLEPSFPQLINNVTLVREGGRQSEQTFVVHVSVSNPIGSTRAATLEATVLPEDPYDYRLLVPGFSDTLFFPPSAENITFSFFLNNDELVEGLEAFLATSEMAPNLGAPFQPPLSDTAFRMTEVQILDDDGRLISET